VELCTTYSSSSPVVTTTSIVLCFSKHRLTQVHLENGRQNEERERYGIVVANCLQIVDGYEMYVCLYSCERENLQHCGQISIKLSLLGQG